MPNQSWNQHAPLRMRLTRMKLSTPGSLSTILLDTFLENDGFIPSRMYYGSDFEVSGKNYSQWIDELKRLDLIKPFKNEASKKSDWIRFTPGAILLPYINKEKTLRKELATKDEVPSKSEFEELKMRMSKIEETVKVLTAASIPPDTEEKRQRRAEATEELAKLALH